MYSTDQVCCMYLCTLTFFLALHPTPTILTLPDVRWMDGCSFIPRAFLYLSEYSSTVTWTTITGFAVLIPAVALCLCALKLLAPDNWMMMILCPTVLVYRHHEACRGLQPPLMTIQVRIRCDSSTNLGSIAGYSSLFCTCSTDLSYYYNIHPSDLPNTYDHGS